MSTFNIAGCIAVQNHATSGSSLLQSLLDYHPNILSLPAMHGRELYNFWERYGNLPAIQLLQAFIQVNAFWGATDDDAFGLREMGPNRDESILIDMQLFAQKLYGLGWNGDQPLTRQRFFATVFVAYAQAQGRVFDQTNYWIVFPIHNNRVEQAIYLSQDFPKVYFIHTIREFTQNMGSHIKHLSKNNLGSMFFSTVYLLEATLRQVYFEDAIHINMYNVHGIHAHIPDTPDGRISSRALRLEDLHKDCENTMRKVMAWVGLPWDPVLVKSTFDGKIWNNRREMIRQAGVGNAIISQKHTEIFNTFDRWRLKQIGKPRYLFYHYAQAKDFAPLPVRRFVLPLLLWLPFKVEWAYSHYRRMHKVLSECIAQGSEVSVRSWKVNADKLKKSRWPLLGFICIYLTFESAIRLRKYLLMAWRESLDKTPPNFVPLLHWRETDAQSAAMPTH